MRTAIAILLVSTVVSISGIATRVSGQESPADAARKLSAAGADWANAEYARSQAAKGWTEVARTRNELRSEVAHTNVALQRMRRRNAAQNRLDRLHDAVELRSAKLLDAASKNEYAERIVVLRETHQQLLAKEQRRLAAEVEQRFHQVAYTYDDQQRRVRWPSLLEEPIFSTPRERVSLIFSCMSQGEPCLKSADLRVVRTNLKEMRNLLKNSADHLGITPNDALPARRFIDDLERFAIGLARRYPGGLHDQGAARLAVR